MKEQEFTTYVVGHVSQSSFQMDFKIQIFGIQILNNMFWNVNIYIGENISSEVLCSAKRWSFCGLQCSKICVQLQLTLNQAHQHFIGQLSATPLEEGPALVTLSATDIQCNANFLKYKKVICSKFLYCTLISKIINNIYL